MLLSLASRLQGLGCLLASPNQLLSATFIELHAALQGSGASEGWELGQIQLLQGEGRGAAACADLPVPSVWVTGALGVIFLRRQGNALGTVM